MRDLGAEAFTRNLGVKAFTIDLGADAFTRNLGAKAFIIDLGAKAPTTNLRDLGADAFTRNLGADAFAIEFCNNSFIRVIRCTRWIDTFFIDLGAKAPTTNLRDLGADAFTRNLGAETFTIEFCNNSFIRVIRCTRWIDTFVYYRLSKEAPTTNSNVGVLVQVLTC